jgi:hypothetical protein
MATGREPNASSAPKYRLVRVVGVAASYWK